MLFLHQIPKDAQRFDRTPLGVRIALFQLKMHELHMFTMCVLQRTSTRLSTADKILSKIERRARRTS
jgi:hypothetical protein